MLSKSQYIRGLQCHKSLWLLKHRPELRAKPDAEEQALFDTGNTVGDLACQLFPGGVEIKFDPQSFDDMIEQTRQLIADGVEVIYEAAFKQNGIFAMADILVKNGDVWDVYEVKSSTSVKGYHYNDAAVQWVALSEVLTLGRIHIVHLNNQYIRQGELDIQQLFTIDDITANVLTLVDGVPEYLAEMEAMLKADEPQILIGTHCDDPHSCDFKSHCWQDVPDVSVFNLYRMNAAKKFDLYHRGIVQYTDIPSTEPLSSVQRIQVETASSGQPLIQPQIVKDFVDDLTYPLHFFDFETFMEAIPRFDGQKPFMQMPFQYSLHILHENGELIHKEYLGDEFSDPRPDLVVQMIQDLGEQGSIIAFNQSFEISRIKELARDFKDYKPGLLELIPRFKDLIVPFRNLGYYHPDFNGSFSIKSLLPAMFPNDPELDYKQLDIQNGGMAMDAFANLSRLKDPDHRDTIRQALLDYCRLDTLAMVRIYQSLHKI
ncbi:DUF2779 domain-containing protein [Thiomicrospira cyclica]|uniref:DUF2779 domain-containing protein n=1 Tax=Thiomicrospira cyclica (strain DSM 14477 / JCM 11371 / ALM1) TaxID=717773 RepID=F6DBU2_THICA|nr:DUF2779 domain-containing protein [Thiomicrospira cyclica]AEG31328.1 hypothetical protein Thicy_0556 [Thiomicrospira cyclica ALM1]